MSHHQTHAPTDSVQEILEQATAEADAHLASEDRDDIVLDAEQTLSPEASREDVFDALLQSLTDRLDSDPAFHQVTGSVFRLQYCEQLLGEQLTGTDFSLAYREHFVESIREGVELGLLDSRLTEYNLEELADCLVPARDTALDYSAMKTLVEWYVVRPEPDGEPLELPQTYWMRMAMELALTEAEQHRIDHAVDYYDVLSVLDR